MRNAKRTAKRTNAVQKFMHSVINVLFIFMLFIPFTFFVHDLFIRKLILIALFFIYNLFFLIFNKYRSLGLIALNSHWEKDYPLKNKLIHLSFYTLSFSTLLFWFFFPFDLFLLNICCIQLLTVILTGTTFHGYLSRMATVR
jgi:hypothetical protein